MKIELVGVETIEGIINVQRIDRQEIDHRITIRHHKGSLIKALAISLASEEKTTVSVTEIAKEISSLFRFEYKKQGIYKEVEFKTLTTEISRTITFCKKKI